MRKDCNYKSKFDKEEYLRKVQNDNILAAQEHMNKKAEHEGTLNRLAELEERLIGDLQRTLQKKNAAVDVLN